MLLDILFVLVGLVALFFGAEWLVKGAARLASSFGVPPLVIGLTLVAFSTSAPELLVSVTAALQGSSDIALGNIVGSNIANIGLILGLTALLFPILVNSQILRRELPLMIVFSVLAFFFALDGVISQREGALLFVCLIAFNLLSYRLARKAAAMGDPMVAEFVELEELEELTAVPTTNRLLEVGRVLLGIATLMVGAQGLVNGATNIALSFGISDLVIGITLVAFGTSLPELATSLVSAYRKEHDISVGNIIGSNIYNVLAVLGITALVQPIPVSPSILRFEFLIMLAFSFALWPMVLDRKLVRWQWALLFIVYLFFMGLLFIR